MQERLAPWRMAGANTRAASLTAALDSNGAAVVTAALSIPVGASTGLITYVVSATCSVLVRAEITPDAAGAPPADEVIRIGIEAGLPASCRRIEWHGLGPGETYADRRTAARVGVFRADAFEWNHAYLPPQETGHRSDVREARITDADGRGLRITAHDSVLGMNLWPWTAADLEFTSHPHRLPARDHLTLTLDQAQIGVGGVMGWGERPLAAYRLKAGRPFRLSFQLHATGK
jgi:beta-galactosidase